MSATRVQLLGPAQIGGASGMVALTSDMRHQALAYLAYQHVWVDREELAYLFWPDTHSATARHNLRQLLKRLRRLDWLKGLETEPQRVRWPVQTDVAAFKSAVEGGRWEEALGCYSGPLLKEMRRGAATEFSAWLEGERERLHDLWRKALFGRVGQLEAGGAYHEAADLLAKLLEHDDFDEDALRAYMVALAQVGRGGQALHVYRVFADRLGRELDLTPTVATEQLATRLREAHPAQPIAARSPQVMDRLAAQPTLPTPATPFVGRDFELAELSHLLAQKACRLLTLTGPGGVGKSRIALQAAGEVTGRYRDGVSFVPLAALTSASAIPSAIAGALHLTLRGEDDPLTQLARHLSEKQILVVLDNFEHLSGGGALASALLRRCPGLDLLVTSRERLGVEEEQLLPLRGLSFPQRGAASLEKALSYDAVRLFIERARRVRPGWSPREADVPHLLAICRLVDGSPLGLELAAVWVRVMPTAEIAHEMAQTLDFLGSDSRAGGRGSLRAAFEHSWKLLTPKEQVVLRKLSVFRSGFTREAAAVVADAPVAILAALIDKSLLRVTEDGRFDRHPILYEYTQEKLAEHPEERRRIEGEHGEYYLRVLRQAGTALATGGGQKEALSVLADEQENIRKAWRWAVTGAKVRDIKNLCTPLLLSYLYRGLLQEGLSAFTETAEGLDDRDHTHLEALGRILNAQAWLHLQLGQHDLALPLARRALELLRSAGDRQGVAQSLNCIGEAAVATRDFHQAKVCFKECVRLARSKSNKNPERLPMSLLNLGNVEAYLRHFTRAEARYREALGQFQKLEHHYGVVMVLNSLGDLMLDADKPLEAESLLLAALKHAEEHGFDAPLVYTFRHLGDAKHELGQDAQARTYFRKCLRLAWPTQQMPHVIRTLIGLVEAGFYGDRPEEKASLLHIVLNLPSIKDMKEQGVKAQRFLKEVEAGLSPEGTEEMQKYARSLKLENVVRKILEERP